MCRGFEGRRTGSLDVTDDGTGLVIHELDADLGDTTARTCERNRLVLSPLFYSRMSRLRSGTQGAEIEGRKEREAEFVLPGQ